MKLSIIIPTYNRAWCIERAIKSVLQQDFQDWEMIIVDDGSTDNTKKVIKKYLDNSKIRYFYKKNGGVGSARNLGIEKARGEFLIFLDSDDELTEDALKIIWQKIISFSKTSLFFFGAKSERNKKTFFVKKNGLAIDLSDVLGRRLVGGEFLPCIRRSVFSDKFKFPESVNGGESLLWWNLLQNYETRYFSEVVRIYHFDANNSLVRGFLNEQQVKNILSINLLTVQKFQGHFEQYNRHWLGETYFIIARSKALLGQKHWRYFKKGLIFKGFDLKNIILYIVAVVDYKIIVTNYLIRIDNFIKNK